MGFKDQVAQQEFPAVHIRFGSQADILTLNLQVGFAPENGHCRAMWRLKIGFD
jgi:hypothetical protein